MRPIGVVWVLGMGCQPNGLTLDAHEVEGGRYLSAAPPEAGDRVLIYFHPYNNEAESSRSGDAMQSALKAYGVVGVYPDGINRTWAHVGSPSEARDELAFFDAVLRDVRARWSAQSVYVSGFSQGGSMAWDIACYRGAEIDAAFPVSGAFWEPLPPSCEVPVDLRHTHGLSDQTVPMAGRPIGSRRQGDVLMGIGVWKQTNGCPDQATSEAEEGPSNCEIWACESGREVRLCLHDGAHRPPEGWLSRNLEWAIAR